MSRPVINAQQDIAEVLSEAFGTEGFLLHEAELGPAFFDLRTGLAGELLQKFVNYRLPLALIVSSPAAYGARFNELAREHRSHPLVRFFASAQEAVRWLDAQRPAVVAQ